MNNNMNELVSVVVPVYKAEKYIRKCVESILKQTYSNIELILIDDGSPDRSGEICDELKKHDSRISVIHKSNEGAGKSRNRGIKEAKGSYITFIDSDDYIEETLIEKCMQRIKQGVPSLVMYGVNNVDECGNHISYKIPHSQKKFFYGNEVTEKFLPELIYSVDKKKTDLEIPACMAMFYSLNIIKKKNWKFESESEYASEDLFSILELIGDIEYVSILEEPLYCYRHGHDSLSSARRMSDYGLIRKFYSQCINLCKRNNYNNEVKSRISEPYISFSIACMKYTALQKLKISDKYKKITNICRDSQLQDVLKSRNLEQEKKTKKILYNSIINKKYFMAFSLIYLQAYRNK